MHKPQSLWDPEGCVLLWDCVGGNSGWQPGRIRGLKVTDTDKVEVRNTDLPIVVSRN